MAVETTQNYSYQGRRPNFERDSVKALPDNGKASTIYDIGHRVYLESAQTLPNGMILQEGLYVFSKVSPNFHDYDRWIKVIDEDGGITGFSEVKGQINDINEAVTPFGSVTVITNSTNVFEKGTKQTIGAKTISRVYTLNVTPYSDGNNASLGAKGKPKQAEIVRFTCNGVTEEVPPNQEPTDGSEASKSYENVDSTTTIYTHVEYHGTIVERNVSFYFQHPSYYGVIDDRKDVDGKVTEEVTIENIKEAEIKALTHYLDTNRSADMNNVSLNDQRFVYAYPESYGVISSVHDANDFDVTDEFKYKNEKGDVTLSPKVIPFNMPKDLSLVNKDLTFEEDLQANPTNYEIVNYLVYVKKNKVTNSGITLKFR